MDGGTTAQTSGMIPRAIEFLYDSFAKSAEFGWTYNVRASFLEIYNEILQDLLKGKGQDKDKDTIKGIEQIAVDVTSKEQLYQFLFTARKNRTTAATESNLRSSRSHSMTTLIIDGYNSVRNETINSYLNLVDLAGSEKLQTIGNDRVLETKNINTSLLYLTQVIKSLNSNNKHIPYRNSKLTMLLKNSLGGNSKTLMIVNVAPFDDCFEESVNSLRFATSVNQCTAGTIKKNKIPIDNIPTPCK